jgi:hypothetical protein
VAERAALVDALREHRLVTAVGPGGVGKTRLALSVAAEVTGGFADGVCYVDLVPVTDSLMIAPTIADALGLGESQSRSPADNVLGWLAERETLLVLDNCEHLLDGVVVLVERLLAGSRCCTNPGRRCCAGSRRSRARSPRPRPRRRRCWPDGRRYRPVPSRRSWPGSPTRACWSRSWNRVELATAPWNHPPVLRGPARGGRRVLPPSVLV